MLARFLADLAAYHRRRYPALFVKVDQVKESRVRTPVRHVWSDERRRQAAFRAEDR